MKQLVSSTSPRSHWCMATYLGLGEGHETLQALDVLACLLVVEHVGDLGAENLLSP